jgi:hypothetical protein
MNHSPDPAWLYYTRIEKQGVVVGVVGHCSECGVKKELRVAFWGDGDRANRYLREQWFNKTLAFHPNKKGKPRSADSRSFVKCSGIRCVLSKKTPMKEVVFDGHLRLPSFCV